MMTKNRAKLVIAIVLTLALTLGANALDVAIRGLNTPVVYACGNHGGGGC